MKQQQKRFFFNSLYWGGVFILGVVLISLFILAFPLFLFLMKKYPLLFIAMLGMIMYGVGSVYKDG